MAAKPQMRPTRGSPLLLLVQLLAVATVHVTCLDDTESTPCSATSLLQALTQARQSVVRRPIEDIDVDWTEESRPRRQAQPNITSLSLAALGAARSREAPSKPVAASVAAVMHSMVRITSTLPDTESSDLLFKPWQQAAGMSQAVGSGSIIGENPLLMVTNAHVVRNAFAVEVTLPALGRGKYHAQVQLLSIDFDVALLTLTKESEERVAKDAAAANFALRPLQISQRTPACPLGVSVLAVGFSLGSETPKISEGVVSGGSSLDGSVECSSTAPISEGNSGGPLLFADDLTVGGLSYASYTGAQNLNLVVPAFRLRQLISKHGRHEHTGWPVVRPSPSISGLNFLPSAPAPHVQVRVPSAVLHTATGSTALHSLTHCSKGVFVSKVPATSVFTAADPKLPSEFFLESIDGHPLDAFGQGHLPAYVDERLSYAELLTLREDLTDNVSISICRDGHSTVHKLPLRWQQHYDGNLPFVPELAFAELDYEVFADIGFMELTRNHVNHLVEAGATTLGRFLLSNYQQSKYVFVSYVAPGCDDFDTIAPGMIVDKLNGVPVRSLQDFRRAFGPKDSHIFTMETDQQVIFATNFTEKLQRQASDINSGASYLLTPAVKAFLKNTTLLLRSPHAF